MSGVDVLAVLDVYCQRAGNEPTADVVKVRAAVAWLMEEAGAAHYHLKELRRRVSATNHDDADYLTEVVSDTSALRAALGRCRGGVE